MVANINEESESKRLPCDARLDYELYYKPNGPKFERFHNHGKSIDTIDVSVPPDYESQIKIEK
jgi:hypothetical protein